MADGQIRFTPDEIKELIDNKQLNPEDVAKFHPSDRQVWVKLAAQQEKNGDPTPGVRSKDLSLDTLTSAVGNHPIAAGMTAAGAAVPLAAGGVISGAGMGGLGELKSAAKMITIAKLLQALDLPPWMAIGLGGGGVGKKAVGGLLGEAEGAGASAAEGEAASIPSLRMPKGGGTPSNLTISRNPSIAEVEEQVGKGLNLSPRPAGGAMPPNLSIKRNLGDVEEQVKRGVGVDSSVGASLKSPSSPFNVSEKAIKEFQDKVTPEGIDADREAFNQQFKSQMKSILEKSKKKGK